MRSCDRGELPAPLFSRGSRQPKEEDGEAVDDDSDRFENIGGCASHLKSTANSLTAW
jgi:hypothetical protein